jgi:hypothetical protein
MKQDLADLDPGQNLNQSASHKIIRAYTGVQLALASILGGPTAAALLLPLTFANLVKPLRLETL